MSTMSTDISTERGQTAPLAWLERTAVLLGLPGVAGVMEEALSEALPWPWDDPRYEANALVPGRPPLEISFVEADPGTLRFDFEPGCPGTSAACRRERASYLGPSMGEGLLRPGNRERFRAIPDVCSAGSDSVRNRRSALSWAPRAMVVGWPRPRSTVNWPASCPKDFPPASLRRQLRRCPASRGSYPISLPWRAAGEAASRASIFSVGGKWRRSNCGRPWRPPALNIACRNWSHSPPRLRGPASCSLRESPCFRSGKTPAGSTASWSCSQERCLDPRKRFPAASGSFSRSAPKCARRCTDGSALSAKTARCRRESTPWAFGFRRTGRRSSAST